MPMILPDFEENHGQSTWLQNGTDLIFPNYSSVISIISISIFGVSENLDPFGFKEVKHERSITVKYLSAFDNGNPEFRF